MDALAIAGLAVIGVGIILVLTGAWQALREKEAPADKGLSDVLTGLAAFADSLAKHPVSLRLVFIGVLLIVIGGTMAGASSLMA